MNAQIKIDINVLHRTDFQPDFFHLDSKVILSDCMTIKIFFIGERNFKYYTYSTVLIDDSGGKLEQVINGSK